MTLLGQLTYIWYLSFRKLTVGNFMKTIVSATQETRRVVPAITCKLDSTLGSVIHNLASKSVHRVYVVAGDDEVVGVVTLRDVISCFIHEPPNHFDSYFGFEMKEMLNQ